jgi:pteridine reductase
MEWSRRREGQTRKSIPLKSKKKVALVTGGAIRVGRAIALELHAAGYTLAIHYNSSAKPAEKLQAKLPGSTIHRANLANTDAIDALAAEVARAHRRIDLLVNSAAIFYPTPVGTVTQKQWDDLHHLNLRAPFFLAQAVRPFMPAGGSIVNIADVGGTVPLAGFVPYGITKAGVISMTHGLARALAPDIRVNAVAPGPVLLPVYYDAKQRKRSIDQTLLKREGTAGDVARAVRFLAENDYITGVTLPVDGGRSLA